MCSSFNQEECRETRNRLNQDFSPRWGHNQTASYAKLNIFKQWCLGYLTTLFQLHNLCSLRMIWCADHELWVHKHLKLRCCGLLKMTVSAFGWWDGENLKSSGQAVTPLKSRISKIHQSFFCLVTIGLDLHKLPFPSHMHAGKYNTFVLHVYTYALLLWQSRRVICWRLNASGCYDSFLLSLRLWFKMHVAQLRKWMCHDKVVWSSESIYICVTEIGTVLGRQVAGRKTRDSRLYLSNCSTQRHCWCRHCCGLSVIHHSFIAR